MVILRTVHVASFMSIGLKEEYRSDEVDIQKYFFAPCYSMCAEYDRCVEYLSIDTLTTIFGTYDNFRRGRAKMRIVTGHKFRPVDLDLLVVLLSKSRNPFERRNIRDDKIRLVRRAFERGQIELKIAISNSQMIDGSIPERLGIFRDSRGHAVAYISSAKSSFGMKGGRFESIDGYTSWGDAGRVRRKKMAFENLWRNKMPYTDVYEFEHAAQKGFLKYWTDWVVHE